MFTDHNFGLSSAAVGGNTLTNRCSE